MHAGQDVLADWDQGEECLPHPPPHPGPYLAEAQGSPENKAPKQVRLSLSTAVSMGVHAEGHTEGTQGAGLSKEPEAWSLK